MNEFLYSDLNHPKSNKYFANRQLKRCQCFYRWILEHVHRLCWIHDLRIRCYHHQLQSYKQQKIAISFSLSELFKVFKSYLKCTYEYPMSHQWLSSWWNLCIDCIDFMHASSVKHAPGMYVWWIMTYGTFWLMCLTSVGGLAFHSLRVTIFKVNASGDAMTHADVWHGTKHENKSIKNVDFCKLSSDF